MRAREAAMIIKKEYPNHSIVECVELSGAYIFGLAEKEREEEMLGGGYFAVSKKLQKVTSYNPTQNLPEFVAGKNINLKEL